VVFSFVDGVRLYLQIEVTNGSIVHPPDNITWVWSPGGMILTGKTEELGENLSQCHFVHHKYHMD
jgi:hypothetical protein